MDENKNKCTIKQFKNDLNVARIISFMDGHQKANSLAANL